MPRSLTPTEIELLKANGNSAQHWDRVLVDDCFDPQALHHNCLLGNVTLGCFNPQSVVASELNLNEGISHCTLRDCEVHSHCAIHHVRLLSNYEVQSFSTIFNVGIMESSTPFAVPPISVMNENGRRAIEPFVGMTIGDAYLWASLRGRNILQKRFVDFVANARPRCAYVGQYAYIANSQKISNVVMMSSQEAPSSIEEAVVVQDGIVGNGCHISYGCVLHRFLLGENVHVEYSARINDTVVGDNSTIARCEVGNSLIFPAHEQHHNNSFLIASNIQGQSNIAAGSTIGSNHNGRTADNELVAHRGFWAGLCSSFKFPSFFSAYTLVANSAYTHELNIRLPFSLVSNNIEYDRLDIMPAFWWMHNMYALQRNEHKFAQRDRRVLRRQHIVFDPIAPDTIGEILNAILLLGQWLHLPAAGDTNGEHCPWSEILSQARSLDDNTPLTLDSGIVENSRRRVAILKPKAALLAYGDMLIHFVASSLFPSDQPTPTLQSLFDTYGDADSDLPSWVNIGGQLITMRSLDRLCGEIESGTISTWDAVHQYFDAQWQLYPQQCRQYAFDILCALFHITSQGSDAWTTVVNEIARVEGYVKQQTIRSRSKDFTNPFRLITFSSTDEMTTVMGLPPEQNR